MTIIITLILIIVSAILIFKKKQPKKLKLDYIEEKHYYPQPKYIQSFKRKVPSCVKRGMHHTIASGWRF